MKTVNHWEIRNSSPENTREIFMMSQTLLAVIGVQNLRLIKLSSSTKSTKQIKLINNKNKKTNAKDKDKTRNKLIISTMTNPNETNLTFKLKNYNKLIIRRVLGENSIRNR